MYTHKHKVIYSILMYLRDIGLVGTHGMSMHLFCFGKGIRTLLVIVRDQSLYLSLMSTPVLPYFITSYFIIILEEMQVCSYSYHSGIIFGPCHEILLFFIEEQLFPSPCSMSPLLWENKYFSKSFHPECVQTYK